MKRAQQSTHPHVRTHTHTHLLSRPLPWTCLTQLRAYLRALRVLERPLVFLSAGRRILSSFTALISSFWVCMRADCSLLQPLVDEGSCSELALNKLYATELLGGDGL